MGTHLDALPYGVPIPEPEAKDIGLITAAATTTQSKSGLSLVFDAGPGRGVHSRCRCASHDTDPVMFHPLHPEQFGEVWRLLNTFLAP